SRCGTGRGPRRARSARRRSWSRSSASAARACNACSARRASRSSPRVREALEGFLLEFAAMRRGSPHTLAAYRRDLARVLDTAAGGGRAVAPAQWTRELLERVLRDLYRSGHAAASASRA